MSDEFEKLLILHCSPTLLGLKQASLFSCPAVKEEEFTPLLGRYNILLNPKDIYFKGGGRTDTSLTQLCYHISACLRLQLSFQEIFL